MNDETTSDIIEKGLRGNAIVDLVDGWVFRVQEVSSNVYKIDGTDIHGHKVSRYGTNSRQVLAECVQAAQLIVQRGKIFSRVKSLVARLLRLKK